MTNFEDTDPNGATIQLFTLQKSNKVIATSANTSKHLVDTTRSRSYMIPLVYVINY